MNLNRLIILISLFLIGVFASFYFEHDFRNLLFEIYTKSTSGNLSFHENRKDIHFPSGFFVCVFGVYLMLLYLLNLKNHWKKIVFKLSINCFIFFLGLGIYTYFNAQMKLISCTACDDGTLKLYKDNLNSDKIFFVSLLFSLLPYLFNLFRKRHFTFSSQSNAVK